MIWGTCESMAALFEVLRLSGSEPSMGGCGGGRQRHIDGVAAAAQLAALAALKSKVLDLVRVAIGDHRTIKANAEHSFTTSNFAWHSGFPVVSFAQFCELSRGRVQGSLREIPEVCDTRGSSAFCACAYECMHCSAAHCKTSVASSRLLWPERRGLLRGVMCHAWSA